MPVLVAQFPLRNSSANTGIVLLGRKRNTLLRKEKSKRIALERNAKEQILRPTKKILRRT